VDVNMDMSSNVTNEKPVSHKKMVIAHKLGNSERYSPKHNNKKGEAISVIGRGGP
jgi:hypothetical protein